MFRTATAAVIWALAGTSSAAANGTSALEARLVDYLRAQVADQRGSAAIEIRGGGASRMVCRSPQPFLPRRGQRLKGAVTVGVHCPGDRPGTRYFQAYIRVRAPYVVAAHALAPGTVLTAADVQRTTGDITRLGSDLATDASALIGQVTVRRIGPGLPLTASMVRPPKLIHRGERVRVVARGPGFSVTTHGQALESAARGQSVRVKTDAGRIVTGTGTAQDTVTLRR